MKSEIITIGDEILIGQVVDTNSAWIAREFNLAGIQVCRITSVGDENSAILEALASAEKNADLVILTGGLGPTMDDLTREAVSKAVCRDLEFREDALRAIAQRAMQRKTGARGLRTILENVLLDTMYDLPSMSNATKVVVDDAVVTGETKPYIIYETDEPAAVGDERR